MNTDEIFRCWAPDYALWSRWAKPAGFLGGEEDAALPPTAVQAPAAVDVSAVPGRDEGAVLVVNLPGGAAVATGLAMAQRGYRPVPLFNGVHGPRPAVDTHALQLALRETAHPLAELSLPADAPPAFLLDAQRLGLPPGPGQFDNRWIVLPQDFPSAAFLGSRGVRRAIVLEPRQAAFDADLAHVLRRWQEGGIGIERLDPAAPPPVPVDVPRPSRFRSLFYRASVLLGLRRNSAGGFGGQVPEPTQGGGFGGGFG